jgi:hypothetical protein
MLQSASPASLQHRLAAALAAATLALTPLAGPVALPPPAAAVLNSPNAQIARSADVALRRAIPGNNGYMRSVQVGVHHAACLSSSPGWLGSTLHSAQCLVLARFSSRSGRIALGNAKA